MAEQKTILLIDDEVDLVDLVKFQLMAKGFHVVTANDGLDGLEKLKNIHPDLIILDVNMPRMGGLEFCNKIATAHGRLSYPVLVLTARTNLEKTFKDIEIDGFMPKPFEIDSLIAEVETIINKSTNPTVFLIDFKENPHVKNICESFRKERYDVTVLEDFESLASAAQRRNPDFIIMEYMQKGISGEEFVKKLKGDPFLKKVPVVVYSYSGFEGYDQKSLKAGAERYLGKPQSYDIFVKTIKELELMKKRN